MLFKVYVCFFKKEIWKVLNKIGESFTSSQRGLGGSRGDERGPWCPDVERHWAWVLSLIVGEGTHPRFSYR